MPLLLPVGMMLADSAVVPDPISPLLIYGPLGLFIALALFGYVWFKPAVDQLKADKAEIAAQRDALLKVNEEKVIPLLGELSRVVSTVLPALTDAAGQLKRAGDELATLSELIRRSEAEGS